ncbi:MULTISPECIES: NAD(P)H:quinone oxidoreductase [unclassified Amycolatopsis]|uniref:NAD(P)H:quinone oxidoreductase n=1 Tax=unclassified Amycolatopsis TaxID=2618356 RepID=UPI001EE8C8D8|nr:MULTISPECIES: NAD(P)H:quinone oxidoreductase [unclassified Amycolatopsis]MCG3752804.1 NAD(P)H:quinone oxidoreductase [Amycolatopsis sp. Poz14]
MSTRILVVYYSATGNTAVLAGALAEGAGEAGAEVRVRTVAETAPPEAIASNRRWQAWVDSGPHHELATLADLEWADGLALGSPTRFGGPAAQLKSFVDTTGGLWAQGKLADKVATSFTSASTAHGGLEATVLAINNIFYHWGAIVLPLGYADPHLMESGNPYGGSFVSRKSAAPDATALQALRIQGRRLATITTHVATGLTVPIITNPTTATAEWLS